MIQNQNSSYRMEQGPTYNIQQNVYDLNAQSKSQGQQQVYNQNLGYNTKR